MTYLQAVIKEGLRIFPPVVGQMSKKVPKGGDTFKGVYLPEGTRIGYGAWGIFRRGDVWGQDADDFRPDRWLTADAESLRSMEATLELVFGHGKWKCLGRNVAMMELQKIFVEVRCCGVSGVWFCSCEDDVKAVEVTQLWNLSAIPVLVEGIQAAGRSVRPR